MLRCWRGEGFLLPLCEAGADLPVALPCTFRRSTGEGALQSGDTRPGEGNRTLPVLPCIPWVGEGNLALPEAVLPFKYRLSIGEEPLLGDGTCELYEEPRSDCLPLFPDLTSALVDFINLGA